MKLYSLNSKLDFGEYSGRTLKDVFDKDPDYVEECILENPSFCFNPSIIDALEDMKAEFIFSEEAVEKLEEKYDIYEEEENDIEEMDSFSDEDIKNLGIMGEDGDDDFDDPGSDGGFYDDGYNY